MSVYVSRRGEKQKINLQTHAGYIDVPNTSKKSRCVKIRRDSCPCNNYLSTVV